jgi:hypothetical protein
MLKPLIFFLAFWSAAVPGYATTISVKDYGATGDGVTNDTSAIQKAITALPTDGGILLFPIGKYLVSSSLDFSGKQSFEARGEGIRSGGDQATTIIGSVPDDDIVKSIGVTSFLFHGIQFRNTSSCGRSALHVEGFTNGTIEFCQITSAGSYGIYAPQNTFTFHVRNVKLNGSHNTGIGMLVGGHTTIDNCDITGWNEGLRLSGTTVNVNGCRLEVNKIAILAGAKEDGSTWLLTRSMICGNSFEANDVGIEVRSANSVLFTGMAMQGSTNAPSGQSKVGILVKGATDTAFSSLAIGGMYSDAAIQIKSGSATKQTWTNVSANNAISIAKVWDVQQGLTDLSFHNTNYRTRPDDGVKQTYLQRHGTFQYLSAVDYLNPSVEGKNLRDKNVSVPPNAVSKEITFTVVKSAGQAAISDATARTGGTLIPAKYYYVGSVVTSHGESGVSEEKSVSLFGPDNAVLISFYGMNPDGFKRRIYRGTQPGVYDGYYELPLNSSSPFLDIGAPFDGRKSPSISDDTNMIEPDSNYAVLVSPNWNTSVWITGKSTTGFIVNFSTPAPQGGMIDWFMIR